MKLYKKVLVFGVFDCLHPGHFSFLRQAKKYGTLMVAVARDSSVKKLKNKKPAQSEKQRVAVLKKSFPKMSIFLGDKILGSYTVIKTQKPDIICLGYDQTGLAEDLAKKIKMRKPPKIRIVILKPFKSEKFKSSLLYQA